MAESVKEWVDDSCNTSRQIGWVTEGASLYTLSVRRIAARCPKQNGQWAIGVIVSALSPGQVLTPTNQPAECKQVSHTVLLAYVYFYDLRGGGVEAGIKENKQGLGTSYRNKQRFAGQRMVGQLEVLAHNLLIWARGWLAPCCLEIAKFDLLRLVRDTLQVSGLVVFDPEAAIQQIILIAVDLLAKELQAGFAALLAQEHIAVILGET